MDNGSEKISVLLEAELKQLRPYTRQEFRDVIGEGIPEGMSEEQYRTSVFDFDRAPHIEKRGMGESRSIVLGVPEDAYPEPALYLFACLQRVETFLYERYRPGAIGVQSEDERSLMFKTGVRKVVKHVAGHLSPGRNAVWSFRHRMIDDLENELWRVELGLSGVKDERIPVLSELAETLLSISPLEMSEMSTPEELAEWFIERAGEPARELAQRHSGGSATAG